MARSQERDVWLLEALGKMRFLTTSEIARLAFGGSRWAANKRLRRLLDAGFVRAWVRSLNQENVYSLDRAGARLLSEAPGNNPPGTVPRGLDGNLDHLLAINGFRISLALELGEAGGEIAWWRSDWEMRSRFRESLVPDALFAVRWGDSAEHPFALEVDNRTRSPRAFLRKILRYGSKLSSGGGLYGLADPVILVAGLDDQWLERYRVLLSQAGLGTIAWFAPFGQVEESGALGEIWRSPFSPDRRSLRMLSALPYGKEGCESGTQVVARS